MRLHISDKDENAWRGAFEAIERIALKHAENPELDEGLLKMPQPQTKTAKFGGIEFIWIPPGWFAAGQHLDTGWWNLRYLSKKYPVKVRRVYLDGYWISKHELTWGDLKRHGVSATPHLNARQKDNLPAYFLSSKQLSPLYEKLSAAVRSQGMIATIPTDDQWEKAARGTDGRFYPWGNRFMPAPAGHKRPGKTLDPFPVGSRPRDRSPYGVMDMAGNVAERTRKNSTGFTPSSSLAELVSGGLGTRGTGFLLDYPCVWMVAYRTEAAPVGFRVVLVPRKRMKKTGR